MSDLGGRFKARWRALRSHYWAALAFDVALIILVFALINGWQTRGLPQDDQTPALALPWLDEMRADTAMVAGQTGVVYFFAPWCRICRHSIGNLDALVKSGQLSWARIVALDYSSLDEVRGFIAQTGVHLPVMVGNAKTFQDWHIRGFPTYFIIDGDGKIVSRSVGYSTKLGLQSRLWLSGG